MLDQPQSPHQQDSTRITLTPDMRPFSAGQKDMADGPAPGPEGRPAPRNRRPSNRWPLLLGAGGVVFGVAALGFSVWTYGEGQKEVLRLSTELAQLRVSLDLYGRSLTGDTGLAEVTERVTALEQGALGGTVPMPATTAATAASEPPAAADTSEDCLPVGMRLLVAAGDSYPICGQTADISVSFVDNGYITLGDGTSVASGGTTPLPGNPACTIAVTSGGDEGLTGYAEIRVSC